MNKEQQIRRLALKVMTREYVDTWMSSPIAALNFISPAEAIRCGKYEEVKQLLFTVESGGYK